MKAVQLIEPQKALELKDIAKPDYSENEVLIKIKAAGICHSDAHYRAGISKTGKLPITLGHEVAGEVEEIGAKVETLKKGDRVCVHYLVTCEKCKYCKSGNEQFCLDSKMIGYKRDGGYAEYISVPERNAVILPEEISYEQGATLMCASATSFHALKKARIKPGETVAIFGAGGLGQSAIQLAKIMGATKVFAVDINEEKLKLARMHGAIPINSKKEDPIEEIKVQNNGIGVDIALEMIGLTSTQKQALDCVAPLGRVVLVGLTTDILKINSYKDILAKEVELIGSNDHLLNELPQLIEYARSGKLDISKIVDKTIPLDAKEINAVLDELSQFKSGVRTVITP